MVLQKVRLKSLTETTSLTFDPDNPRYKFCCESFKATYGMIAVGILEILGSAGFFSHVMINEINNAVMVAISSTIFILTLIFVAVAFYGVIFEKAKAIFPHMVFQVSEVIILIIAAIIFVFSLLDRIHMGEGEEKKVAGLVLIIGCVFLACFQIWFFLIVLSCYRYLRDKVQPVAV